MAVKFSLKLLVDKKNNKVLFAEAEKDFVDFLFSLMTFPIGSLATLLTSNQMVGSIGKIYSSIKNLSKPYLQSNLDKNLLLEPKAALLPIDYNPLLLLKNEKSTSSNKCYYTCNSNQKSRYRYDSNMSFHLYITEVSGTLCPSCGGGMTTKIPLVAPKAVETNSSAEEGFVTGLVTYMVMDDLEFSPMSTISRITVLHNFNIKDLGAVEEMVVKVGVEEGVALLKTSLQSNTVFTDVFLAKKLKEGSITKVNPV